VPHREGLSERRADCLAETDAWRQSERARHERLRRIVSVLAMLLGGFLAGQVASRRSDAMESARPVAIEPGTSASRTAPAAPRRTAGQSAKPTTKRAR
jgi:hypothetical protein